MIARTHPFFWPETLMRSLAAFLIWDICYGKCDSLWYVLVLNALSTEKRGLKQFKSAFTFRDAVGTLFISIRKAYTINPPHFWGPLNMFIVPEYEIAFDLLLY